MHCDPPNLETWLRDWLSLARRIVEPEHLLHSALTCTSSAAAWRLKSRHPFVPPHNNSSIYLTTTTYARRSGRIINAMRSGRITLQDSAFLHFHPRHRHNQRRIRWWEGPRLGGRSHVRIQNVHVGQWFSNFLRSRTTWCFFKVGVYTPWFQKNVICSNVLKINIGNKRISNVSITHERIITQKRINKAFRIWQESCSRTTWKALAYH